MKIAIAIAASLLFAQGAHARVYKCKGKSGETVYSQDPCDSSAKPMQVRGTKAATITEAEMQTRAAVFKSTDLSDSAIAERNCLAGAGASINRPSNERVANYQRQIAGLNRQLATAKNNLAGATFASGLHTQIAGLNQSIATERSAAAAQMTTARQQCAEERRQRQQRIEDQYAPMPAE